MLTPRAARRARQAPSADLEQTEHELYGSLLASRDHARRRLLAIREIERHHRNTSLEDLAELAVSGALHHLIDLIDLTDHPEGVPPVTISRDDVHALSSGPGAGGVPLPTAEEDRIAAVLNEHTTHRPAEEIEEAAAAPPAQIDLRADHELLTSSLTSGELRDRMGSSP